MYKVQQGRIGNGGVRGGGSWGQGGKKRLVPQMSSLKAWTDSGGVCRYDCLSACLPGWLSVCLPDATIGTRIQDDPRPGSTGLRNPRTDQAPKPRVQANKIKTKKQQSEHANLRCSSKNIAGHRDSCHCVYDVLIEAADCLAWWCVTNIFC